MWRITGNALAILLAGMIAAPSVADADEIQDAASSDAELTRCSTAVASLGLHPRSGDGDQITGKLGPRQLRAFVQAQPGQQQHAIDRTSRILRPLGRAPECEYLGIVEASIALRHRADDPRHTEPVAWRAIKPVDVGIAGPVEKPPDQDPWQKPPSRKSRRILLPHNKTRSDVRPQHFDRRVRLVSAIAKGRHWLDEVIAGQVTTVQEICVREKCSVRQVNMTISLAFLAPCLVKAAVNGRLPRGVGVERLRDLPSEWSKQFEALGLTPE